MTMRQLPYFLIIGLALPGTSAAGPDMRASCPETIPESSFAPARPPAGWVGSIPTPLHLNAAGMMAGPPESMTYLVPSKHTRTTQTFEFQKGDWQRWLWCSYGAAQLSRRLDDAATSCTVTSRTLKRDGIATFIASVECR